jgi:WD40 repeat protein
MLSGGIDNTIYKWDLESGIREVFHELANPPTSLAISGNDQSIAVGTRDGRLLLFQGGGANPPVELYRETGNQIMSLAFRNQGNMLVSGDQKGWLRIWTVDQRKLAFRRKMHDARIIDIKLDPSQRYLATSSTDGRVKVLDLDDINESAIEIVNLNGFALSVEFINRGRNIVIGSRSSNPLVGYPVRMEDLSNFVCPNISRNFSQSEWRTHIGDDVPFEETCSK